jgi:hypothetical protein
MKPLFLFICINFTCLILTQLVPAQITVGGVINQDTTWSSGIYILRSDIIVKDNATLTILPGATVYIEQFMIDLGGWPPTRGHLSADNVTFTGSDSVGYKISITWWSSIHITHCTFDGVDIYSDTTGVITARENFFDNIQYPFITLLPNNHHTIQNNTFGNNVQFPGLGISGEIYSDFTLPDYGLTYYLTDNIKILNDARLTLKSYITVNLVENQIIFEQSHMLADSAYFICYASRSRNISLELESSAQINNCIFNGVNLCSKSAVFITAVNNTFINADTAISILDQLFVNITDNDFINIRGHGIFHPRPDSITARYNYWGHPTGPQHPSNPDGKGVYLSNHVIFKPWSEYPNNLSFLTLKTPNGGEDWSAGSVHPISWHHQIINQLDIGYSCDAGVSWILIDSNVTAGDKSYNWLIPNTPSTECLVKICDALNPWLCDSSDAFFTISESSIIEAA